MTTRAERRAQEAARPPAPSHQAPTAEAPPQPPPAAPTARQRLDALNERRTANGGFLIPKPAGIATPLDFLKWLDQVAKIGGAGDVEIAWHYGTQNGLWKEKIRSGMVLEGRLLTYDSLRHEAGARMFELTEAVEDERRQAQIAYEAEQSKREKARQIRLAEAQLAELKSSS